jgi:hypothetical protein
MILLIIEYLEQLVPEQSRQIARDAPIWTDGHNVLQKEDMRHQMPRAAKARDGWKTHTFRKKWNSQSNKMWNAHSIFFCMRADG